MKTTDDGVPIVELDERSENWLRELRLERLRARGWTGTLVEWVRIVETTGQDPLEHG